MESDVTVSDLEAKVGNHPVVSLDLVRLTEAMEAAFRSVGAPDEEAVRVTDALVSAECANVPTHGLLRFPWYLDGYRNGKYNVSQKREWIRETGAVAVLDAKGSLGYQPTWEAVQKAVLLSRDLGIGFVAITQVYEFGRAAYYTSEAARQGVVGIVCQNTKPLVGPPGATAPSHGNNPLSYSGPGAEAPLYDAAFTPRSGGEVKRRELLGLALEPEWGYVDADGRPTVDPTAALQGVQTAVGGAKGFGIAVLVDLLAGGLSGAPSGPGVGDGSVVGAAVIAIDPDVLGTRDHLVQSFAEASGFVRDHGGRWPGQRSRTLEQRNRERGTVDVPLPIYETAEASAGGWMVDPRS